MEVKAPGNNCAIERDILKVTLLVLTWNEIAGMPIIMPQIDRSKFHQIIIVDGGSTDGTIEWAKENGYDVYVQKRKGLRFAYREVMELVTGDAILTISPDGNCLPESVHQLRDKIEEGYDLVIGSRYLDYATSDDDDMITGFGNWMFTTLVNVLHGGKYTDAMTILRVFRKELIYELDLDKDEAFDRPERLFNTLVSWEPLMSVRAAKAKMKIGEIPAPEPARIGGERKLQIVRWGLTFLYQFIREVFFWKPKNKAP